MPALLAIGAYTSALLSLDFACRSASSIICGGLDQRALLGTLLIFAVVPSARALRLDRDAGDRRDRIAGDPELGKP